jgi:hypothetical protein
MTVEVVARVHKHECRVEERAERRKGAFLV